MNKKILKSIVVAFIVTIVLIPLEATETKPQPTIAVLGTTPELSDLCALVEVGLFQEGITLVERAKIDKILQEQKLTAAGLVERKNLLKLGQLVRADGFLLISVEETVKQEENKKDSQENILPLLRIRLIDTAYGLRFLDTFESWDNTKLKETAERITENVIEIVPKLILPPDKAIPIGIVGIHRVELDERYQWLTRALPAMLSARLNKEPRIIMLEREDLKMLLEEKQLAQGKDTEFFTSAILIDGYLQREDKEEVKLTLQIKDFSGKERAIFTELVNPDEPLITIDKIITNIIPKVLNSPPTSSWEPKKESEEFFREGDLLRKHGRHKDAIEPLETAYALRSDNVVYTGALFENEWGARVIQGPWPKETGISYYLDLELACVVSRLVRQIKAGYENGSLSANDIFQWEELIGRGGSSRGGYLVNSASASTQEVRDINRENRRIWIEAVKEVIKKNSSKRYLYLDMAEISSDNPDELIKNFRETLPELIMPPEVGNTIQSFDERYIRCSRLTRLPYLYSPYTLSEKSQLRDQSKKFKELWKKYLKELTETKDPLVRLSSCISLGCVSERGSKEAKEYCLKAVDILLNELKSPNEPFSNKMNLRDDMKDCIRLAGFTYDEELNIFEKIYKPLIENKDCLNLALWNPQHVSCQQSLFRPTTEEEKHYAELLGKIAKVLENCKDNNQVFTALTGIKDYLTGAKKKFPELESINKPLPFQVTILLSNKLWPEQKKFKHTKFMLQDNMLWIAFAEPGVGLAGIDLKQKELTSLWYTNLDNKRIEFPCFWEPPPLLVTPINSIAVSKNTSYVVIWNIGLVEFPGSPVTGVKSFTNPKILTEKDGLPSISITSMAGDGDKLWIAYGGTEQRNGRRVYDTVYGVAEKDSGLGIYTPQTKQWETIFCSTLKSDDNPFNSGKPYMIFDLTFSPKRDKLFFVVGAQVPETANKYDEMNKWWGLWEIDTNTKKPKFVWYGQRLVGHPQTLNFGYLFDSGNKWWLKGVFSLIEFDPNTEKAKVILGREGATNPRPELEIDTSFSKKKIPIGYLSSGAGTGAVDCKCSAIYNDRFWGRLGHTQLITIHKDGKGMEDAQIFDNNILDGEKVLYFFSTPYGLIAVGNGTVGLIETESIDK